eukprot:jgi/Psemu1/66641/estExt_Genemark1.C_2260003
MKAGGRRIKFHGRVQFKKIPHVNEFTDQEIRDGWYHKDDFNAMSDEVSDIAALVESGQTTLNGEELCLRGLEHIVQEELADFRAQKMISSIDAVLDAQEEQWDEGKDDPDVIAVLYAEYGKPLLQEAHEIGLQDELEGYKTWDDLFQCPIYQERAAKHNSKPDNAKTPKVKINKKKIKKPSPEPPELPEASEPLLSPDGVGSLQESFALHDSISLISEEYLIDKSESSATDENGSKNSNSPAPKRQRERKAKNRKYGTELSPFVLTKAGTIAFKKPEEEKFKREQKQKRKSRITNSLKDFLKDDGDDDILAGILSSSSKRKPKKSTGRKYR